MSRALASIGVRARMPPRARPCVADRLGRRLGTIRGTSRSARRNESVADETDSERVLRVSGASFLSESSQTHVLQAQHCHESVSQDRMALMWRARI